MARGARSVRIRRSIPATAPVGFDEERFAMPRLGGLDRAPLCSTIQAAIFTALSLRRAAPRAYRHAKDGPTRDHYLERVLSARRPLPGAPAARGRGDRPPLAGGAASERAACHGRPRPPAVGPGRRPPPRRPPLSPRP